MSGAARRDEPGGILAIWTDIAPEREADFNEWYWREHFPERLGVPGFRRARRGRAIAGSPRYFAWYELDGVETLASAAYLARLDHPSAWTERVMPGFRNTTRAIFRPVTRLGQAGGGAILTLRLAAAAARALPAELLPQLAAERGITRVQFWQAAEIATPATREAALRGAADRAAEWTIIVEAQTAEELEAATRGLPSLTIGATQASYQLLCSMDAAA